MLYTINFIFSEMKNLIWYLFLFFILMLSCEKEDSTLVDVENTVNLSQVFYGKTWSVYEVESNGKRLDVPEEGDCGRDYFRYLENGQYIEYLQNSSSCKPAINRLNFTLSGSLITLSNELGGESEFRILELDDTNFIFETNLDIDGDNKEDKVKLFCRIYSPQDIDVYSETFGKDFYKFQDDNLIAFTWAEYVGGDFKQYEIYRSSNSCDKTDAIKVATITDLSENVFVDLDPEPVEELCYFFRLQTNNGQLAESDMVTVNTRDIDTYFTKMLTPNVVDQTVQLNWEKYESPYFLKYEITVSQRAYYDNSPEQIFVATIEDQETTSYTIDLPPSVEDPFYNIHVYNIFGQRSSINLGEEFISNSVEVKFRPNEMVDMLSVHLIASDPLESKYLYLWGEGVSDTYKKIKKIDIETNKIVATSSFDLNTSSEERLKVIESNEGKEVLILVGWEYHVFDAQSLNYKYRLQNLNNEHISFQDLIHFKNDIWIIADGTNKLRTFRRFGRDLQELDSLEPEPTVIDNSINELIRIKDNKVLVGLRFNERSFEFEINENGTIANSIEVDYNFISQSGLTLYNNTSNILLDKQNSSIYNATDYIFISSYNTPVHTSTMSIDGAYVLGTNYNGRSSLDFYDVFDRELNILNWKNGQTTTLSTVGYPQFVYENQDGKLVVVSSYFKRSSFRRGVEKNDLFVEVYDWR